MGSQRLLFLSTKSPWTAARHGANGAPFDIVGYLAESCFLRHGLRPDPQQRAGADTRRSRDMGRSEIQRFRPERREFPLSTARFAINDVGGWEFYTSAARRASIRWMILAAASRSASLLSMFEITAARSVSSCRLAFYGGAVLITHAAPVPRKLPTTTLPTRAGNWSGRFRESETIAHTAARHVASRNEIERRAEPGHS